MEEQVWAKIELEKLLSAVTETELFVIKNRLEGRTLDEIAAAIGRSKERVRQHENKAIRKMRAWHRSFSRDVQRQFDIDEYFKPDPTKAETRAKWDALWEEIWG